MMRGNWILGLAFTTIATAVTFIGGSHMAIGKHNPAFSPLGMTLIVFMALWGTYIAGSERREGPTSEIARKQIEQFSFDASATREFLRDNIPPPPGR